MHVKDRLLYNINMHVIFLVKKKLIPIQKSHLFG